MEKYNQLYEQFVKKTDAELKKIINPQNGYPELFIEVAKDILCYERKICDPDDINHLFDAKGVPIHNQKREKTKDLTWGNSRALDFVQLCGILALMLTIYPLGVYFLWKNKKFDKTLKVIETVSCLMLWPMLIMLCVNKISYSTETNTTTEIVTQGEDEKADVQEIGHDRTPYLFNRKFSNETKKKETDSGDEIGELEASDEREEEQEVSGKEIDESEYVDEDDGINELEINGENIIDITVREMKEGNDYVTDVDISLDEAKEQINISVQVPASTDTETAKMAGEDIARYLAFNASLANSYFESPGSDDIGGIYEEYNLLIYIDDGNHSFDIYGAKVTTANQITWN